MHVITAIIGGVFLFLGRDLNFFFSAALAALLGLRLTPLLPPQWPAWTDYAFMVGLAVGAASIVITRERFGYFLVSWSVVIFWFNITNLAFSRCLSCPCS